MEENLDESIKSPPKCKFCLGEEDLKDMWTVTAEDEEPEIYGEMLNDCFALLWEHQDDNTEFICEFCVQRLKDAVSFKNQIQFARSVMQENKDIVTTVDEDGKLQYTIKQEQMHDESTGDYEMECQSVKQEPDSEGECVEYLELEYLDDDDVRSHEQQSKNKRKQHFQTDLEKCLTSIKKNVMTFTEAADYYNVALETVVQKLEDEGIDVTNQDKLSTTPNDLLIRMDTKRSQRARKKRPTKKLEDNINVTNRDKKSKKILIRTDTKRSQRTKKKPTKKLEEDDINVTDRDKKSKTILIRTDTKRSLRTKKKPTKKFEEDDINVTNRDKKSKTRNKILIRTDTKRSQRTTTKKPTKKLEDGYIDVSTQEKKPTSPSKILISIDTKRSQRTKEKTATADDFFDSIEVLEEELDEDVEYVDTEFLDDDEGEEYKNPASPQKQRKPKSRRAYTKEDFRKCLEAVKTKRMRRSEAAKYYNVPIKTIHSRLRAEAEKAAKGEIGPDAKEKTDLQQKQAKLIEEIKILLTYTNVTPYKGKTTCKYYCAYCTTEGPLFDSADNLRSHTRTQHTTDKFTGVEEFMNPRSSNEVLKVDIHNMTCMVCSLQIETWNDMFLHLANNHEVTFVEAYERVIPYLLNEDLYCALCKSKFYSYNQLDSHMNAHYTNYVCGSCGDTFLSESRLKKHEEIHEISRFPCQYCDKVFSLKKYRAKHTLYVHLSKEKFPCRICSEKFQSSHIRHQHMINEHDFEAQIYVCDECGKTYDWKPYYLKHMRLTHRERKKTHQCTLCDKKFSRNYELRNHYEWHAGTRKHVCMFCDKQFASNQYLQKHMVKHHEIKITAESVTLTYLEAGADEENGAPMTLQTDNQHT